MTVLFLSRPLQVAGYYFDGTAANWPSQLGSSGLTSPQLGAAAVQMNAAGQPMAGSSSAPARTTIRSGRSSASLNSGVPHLTQKRRRITFPLSALLMYSLVSPEILRPAVLKIALMDALPDDRYWQSLHQQARVATGRWSKLNWVIIYLTQCES